MKIDKKCLLTVLRFTENFFTVEPFLIINPANFNDFKSLSTKYDFAKIQYHFKYMYDCKFISEFEPDGNGAYYFSDLTPKGREYLETHSLKGRVKHLYSFVYKFFPLFWVTLQIFNYFYKIIPNVIK